MNNVIGSLACVALFALSSNVAFAKHRHAGGGSGLCSYYASGHRTASGERFDPNGFTAAHRSLPFGTRLQVTNLRTGRSATVRVNDRGPFVRGRVLDVSRGAASALGMLRGGTAPIRIVRLD